MVGNYLGRIVADGLPEAFDQLAGRRVPGRREPHDRSRSTWPNLRGDADSYAHRVGPRGRRSRTPSQDKAAIFAQAALIDALALFLLGVAGINRLRSARFATLVLGAAAYLASLVMMATAY